MAKYIINEYQTDDQGNTSIVTPVTTDSYNEAESTFCFKKGYAAINTTVPHITITWDDWQGFRVDQKHYGPERYESSGGEPV